MAIDEGADIGFELPDRGMNTSTEPLSGELSKPKKPVWRVAVPNPSRHARAAPQMHQSMTATL